MCCHWKCYTATEGISASLKSCWLYLWDIQCPWLLLNYFNIKDTENNKDIQRKHLALLIVYLQLQAHVPKSLCNSWSCFWATFISYLVCVNTKYKIFQIVGDVSDRLWESSWCKLSQLRICLHEVHHGGVSLQIYFMSSHCFDAQWMTYYLADINDESKRWMGACELPKQLPQRRPQLHPTTVWAAGWVGEPQRERSLRHQIVLSRIDKIAFPTITPEMDYVYFSRWLAAVIARDNVLHLDEWRRSYRKDVVLSWSAPAHTRVDRVHCATRTSQSSLQPLDRTKPHNVRVWEGFLALQSLLLLFLICDIVVCKALVRYCRID